MKKEYIRFQKNGRLYGHVSLRSVGNGGSEVVVVLKEDRLRQYIPVHVYDLIVRLLEGKYTLLKGELKRGKMPSKKPKDATGVVCYPHEWEKALDDRFDPCWKCTKCNTMRPQKSKRMKP